MAIEVLQIHLHETYAQNEWKNWVLCQNNYGKNITFGPDAQPTEGNNN